MTATLTTTHHETPSTYTDDLVLTLPAPTGCRAIDWMRAIIEQSPLPLRYGLPPGWRLLGLGLASSHAPDHVHGWPVVVDRPDQVVLGSRSRLGFDARLSVQVDGATVRFTTAIRHGGRASRLLWAGLAPGHRVTVGLLLRSAATRVHD